MHILSIIIGAVAFLFGVRMILTASQAAWGGKILVRQGIRTRWQPIGRNEAWKVAVRDAVMGLLLIVLGTVLIL